MMVGTLGHYNVTREMEKFLLKNDHNSDLTKLYGIGELAESANQQHYLALVNAILNAEKTSEPLDATTQTTVKTVELTFTAETIGRIFKEYVIKFNDGLTIPRELIPDDCMHSGTQLNPALKFSITENFEGTKIIKLLGANGHHHLTLSIKSNGETSLVKTPPIPFDPKKSGYSLSSDLAKFVENGIKVGHGNGYLALVHTVYGRNEVGRLDEAELALMDGTKPSTREIKIYVQQLTSFGQKQLKFVCNQTEYTIPSAIIPENCISTEAGNIMFITLEKEVDGIRLLPNRNVLKDCWKLQFVKADSGSGDGNQTVTLRKIVNSCPLDLASAMQRSILIPITEYKSIIYKDYYGTLSIANEPIDGVFTAFMAYDDFRKCNISTSGYRSRLIQGMAIKYKGGEEVETIVIEGDMNSKSIGDFNDFCWGGDRGWSEKGEITYHLDGSKYDGRLFCLQRHGKGTHTCSDGGKYEGIWEDNRLEGIVVYTDARGGSYTIWVKDGKVTLPEPSASRLTQSNYNVYIAPDNKKFRICFDDQFNLLDSNGNPMNYNDVTEIRWSDVQKEFIPTT